ncbi:MAG: redoxin domain-containing protein [Gammaproteobacteria bacterium]|nr:redoxin domain-containing protein [Gammaproteobacteria bacterium]
MVGFEQHKQTLNDMKVSVVCASVDPLDKALEVANEVSFPVGHGVSRDIADTLGSWWEERRQIIQPSEFILGPDDKVMASSYSDGPLARMLADDVVSLISMYIKRAQAAR